ncbi:MAG: enoyl-CoA hydratase/isomerase family protein [Deltaproteobacteria bacterium]|nr:enoyl-CoA hydratase/isomerase family protein [Deltaproteobacteria bacterium]
MAKTHPTDAPEDAPANEAPAPDSPAEDGPAFRLEEPDERGISVIWFDRPGKKVNTMSVALMGEFEEILGKVKANKAIKAGVMISGKDSGFVAGADIDDLNLVTTAQEGAKLSREGHRVMAAIETLGVPTVAAVHGDCLGGGLELALAATARIAADTPKTKMGLPEVMLGLLPGAGGTVRLPALIGLDEALPLILQGKTVRPRKALKLGLVDKVVPKGRLLAEAKDLAFALAEGKKRKAPKKAFAAKAQSLFVNTNPVGKNFALKKAREEVMKNTKGLYPAALAILDVLDAGTYDAEAEAFGRLIMTRESAGLRHLFHCITTLKKDDGPGTADVEAREVKHVGMLGAGLMGGGIATVLADKGYTVRFKDIVWDGVQAGIGYAETVYRKNVKRKRYSREGAAERLNRISGGLTWDGIGHADLLIEAVPEKLGLKQTMVKQFEDVTKVGGIFASNTSALPITEIASAAAKPENVVGMHFFSPVEKMPLVEVIVTDKTDPVVTKTTVAVARKMGKHVIVVGDCAGFYTTRVLAPYMVEATMMMLEGHSPLDIDEAAMAVGFPVGPITLMDEVGIDVGAKVTETMETHYGDRMEFPDSSMTSKFVEEGRIGKKANKGFYRYENGKSVIEDGNKVIDPAIFAHMPEGTTRKAADPVAMGERLVLALVNEAAFCLHEGVLFNPESADLGAVFGIGFPPMEGGPFRYADRIGLAQIVARLNALESAHGRRFAPCPLLVEMAETSESFYG